MVSSALPVVPELSHQLLVIEVTPLPRVNALLIVPVPFK